MQFGLACCAIELMGFGSARIDASELSRIAEEVGLPVRAHNGIQDCEEGDG